MDHDGSCATDADRNARGEIGPDASELTTREDRPQRTERTRTADSSLASPAILIRLELSSSTRSVDLMVTPLFGLPTGPGSAPRSLDERRQAAFNEVGSHDFCQDT